MQTGCFYWLFSDTQVHNLKSSKAWLKKQINGKSINPVFYSDFL